VGDITEIRAQRCGNLPDSDPEVWTLHPLFRSQKDLTPTYRCKVLVIPKMVGIRSYPFLLPSDLHVV
jgi:hypothetical protein